MWSWRRGLALRLLGVVLAALTSAACHDRAAPVRLLDGSRATEPTVELATIDDAMIASNVEVRTVAGLAEGSAAATCLDQIGDRPRAGPVVTRIGVVGESVTFRVASGRGLHACDGTGLREPGHRWCGSAYGRLEDERLTDPRLDLTCTTAIGDPVAFAWIEPAADARYVAVRQRAFAEVYEVAADLPVRVTTTIDLGLEESTAAFEISEHDARGTLLRSYTLRTRVAG